MSLPRLALLIVACALAGCELEQIDGRGNAVVLTQTAASELLKQCSRDAPAKDGTWTPDWSDIQPLEASIPSAVAAARPEMSELALLDDWRRQYVGITRGGRRYIYGNYFPKSPHEADRWTTEPIMICDGGPSFFGVEYDVEAGRITRVDFNGRI